MELLTTKQVADYLQLGEQTLHNWRSAGWGPPSIKLAKQPGRGGAVRYERNAVDRWLDSLDRSTPERAERKPHRTIIRK